MAWHAIHRHFARNLFVVRESAPAQDIPRNKPRAHMRRPPLPCRPAGINSGAVPARLPAGAIIGYPGASAFAAGAGSPSPLVPPPRGVRPPGHLRSQLVRMHVPRTGIPLPRCCYGLLCSRAGVCCVRITVTERASFLSFRPSERKGRGPFSGRLKPTSLPFGVRLFCFYDAVERFRTHGTAMISPGVSPVIATHTKQVPRVRWRQRSGSSVLRIETRMP
jgi:hypothetical protein